jgi:hypothetical protein
MGTRRTAFGSLIIDNSTNFSTLIIFCQSYLPNIKVHAYFAPLTPIRHLLADVADDTADVASLFIVIINIEKSPLNKPADYDKQSFLRN